MEVRVLADTNLFIKFCRRLPLPALVESTLADAKTERCLSPVSVIELFRLWQSGKVPHDPDTWLDLALPSWTVLPVTVPVARQSVLWPWDHKDPARSEERRVGKECRCRWSPDRLKEQGIR